MNYSIVPNACHCWQVYVGIIDGRKKNPTELWSNSLRLAKIWRLVLVWQYRRRERKWKNNINSAQSFQYIFDTFYCFLLTPSYLIYNYVYGNVLKEKPFIEPTVPFFREVLLKFTITQNNRFFFQSIIPHNKNNINYTFEMSCLWIHFSLINHINSSRKTSKATVELSTQLLY